MAVPDPDKFECRPRDLGFPGLPVSDGLNRTAQDVCDLLVGQCGILVEILELVVGTNPWTSRRAAGFNDTKLPCCFFGEPDPKKLVRSIGGRGRE